MTFKRPTKKERALAREILFEARRLLARPRGWVKGTLTATGAHVTSMEIDATGIEDHNPHCAVGGLDAAARALVHSTSVDRWDFTGTVEYKLAELTLKKALNVDLNGTNYAIFDFNDKGSTRKKHIIAAFDAAVQSLDA